MISFLIKFFQCFFCWKVKPSAEEELRTAQAILSECFGLRGHKPGKSNEALAIIVRESHERFHLPLILTWEVADCLPDLNKVGIIGRHRIKGKRRDAYETIVQEASICKENGWTRAIVIAYHLHYWRCVMIARKLGLEVLTVDTSSVPCDKYSDQWWTRSDAYFIPYEIGARIFYLFTGKI